MLLLPIWFRLTYTMAKAWLLPENAKLWSPESPFLYGMKVTLKRDGKVVDEVSGYTAMRTSKAFVMAEPPYNVPLLEGTS